MDTFTLSVTDNQKTFKIVTSLYQPPKINGLLLLCHANGFHRQIWDTTVSSLKKQYPQMALCSFDIRTHGDSGILNRSLLFENGIPVPITHGQLGQDVVQIMNQLRERFPHVFGSGIYGLGHSVGGASLICAQSIQPLFDGLVLIEPIVYPRNISKDKNFMYRNALKRTRVFDSKEGLLAKWRTNPFFQTWDPLVLQSYIEHGVIPSENGFELKTLPEHEAEIFGMSDEGLQFTYQAVGRIHCPCVIVKGEKTDTFPPGYFETVVKRFPNVIRYIIEPDVGHLVPMERPHKPVEYLRILLAKSKL